MPLGAVMQDVQVSASIHAIEGKVDLVKREMESVNTHINRFKLQIEELSKKPDVPAEFESIKSSIDSFIKGTQDRHVSTMCTISDIKSTLQTAKITIANQDNEIRMLRQSVPMLDEKIETTKQDLSSKIVSISTAFSNRFDAHADQQKKQLDVFGAQAMAAPKSVMESNNSILEKLEVATLDASNSMMKVNNLELSMKVWERKLENLTIQVKKLELSQQA